MQMLAVAGGGVGVGGGSDGDGGSVGGGIGAGGGIGGGGKYIYATNIYSNKIINNINNYINEKCITEAIIFLRIMFLFYYNYYVYKLDL